VPDAGTFWYHPHVMSAAQVGFGLYGAFVVDDLAEDLGIADELVLVLSDIDVDESGTLRSPDTGGSLGMVFGREGNWVLVNGRHQPAVTARSGSPQRWRIINAANSRYFMLDLAPATCSGRSAAMADWSNTPKTTTFSYLAPASERTSW